MEDPAKNSERYRSNGKYVSFCHPLYWVVTGGIPIGSPLFSVPFILLK
jgi:hypothetical protein